MNWQNYLSELQRRHVVKAGIAYLVVAWLVTQVLSILIPVFEFSQSTLKTAIIIMAIGFPIWLIFAWVYDFTPDGLKKTDDVTFDSALHAKKNVKLNRFIIGGLLLAVVLLVVNQLRMRNEMTIIKSTLPNTEQKSSIAVMAFADMSPKKDHEYFSDGISEELLNILAKIPDLKVISRTSSFSYKGKNSTATEIGKDLDVSHILEGSIRKAGNTVRITAQLINTEDGTHEWSHTYDRNLDSIFKIQDEIASEVSKQLQLSLLGFEPKIKTTNTDAYNLYLQAAHLTNQNTKASYIKAEEKIKNAIELDQDFADAWCMLAKIYDTGVYNFSIREPKEGIPLGIEAARKAIALDPNSAKAYTALSSLQEMQWEFEASAKNIAKALALEPNNAAIIGTAALMSFGDVEKAIELQRKAIQLDPLVYANYFNLGFANFRLNNLEEAEKAFNTFALYYPNWQILHYMMSRLRLAQGRYDEALAEIEMETNDFFNLYGKNFIYFALDQKEIADSLFQEFKERYGENEPSNLADLYAFRGDFDSAFTELYRALEIKDPVLPEALTYRSFIPMRKDPRWNDLIDKMNLPEGHGYTFNE